MAVPIRYVVVADRSLNAAKELKLNKIQPAVVYTLTFLVIPAWGFWLCSLIK